METVRDMLSTQPFLAGLTKEQLDRLLPWSRKATFAAGARIFEEGRRAERFWIIRAGHVALETQVPGRGAVVLETLGPGAVLGWSWLFPPYRWHFSAAAAAEVTLALEFDAAAVRELCERDPAFGFDLAMRFTEVVVERLQATRVRLLDLYRVPS
jgi:CRP/FNR family cyclic AMP-dependent transcriptional regulator